MAGNHKDLIVWRKSMDLVLDVYRVTTDLPREETCGLTAQMRRAAVSIPSNIAEGRGRDSSREMTQFLVNARGSLLELETQIETASALAYITSRSVEHLLAQCSEVARLLNGLLNRTREQVPIT